MIEQDLSSNKPNFLVYYSMSTIFCPLMETIIAIQEKHTALSQIIFFYCLRFTNSHHFGSDFPLAKKKKKRKKENTFHYVHTKLKK